MTRNKITENEEIGLTANLDLNSWPRVDIESIKLESHDLFRRRKKAIEMYILNVDTVNNISLITGLNRFEIRRLVKRCLQLDELGVVWGYRALIPHKKIKKYERVSLTSNTHGNNNFSGAFRLLLDKYPIIEETIIDLYLKRKKRQINEPVISIKSLHKRFIDLCRKVGLTIRDYPLNTNTLAKKSLERYVKELDCKYFNEAANRHGEEAARIATSTGIGTQNNPLVIRPYQQVQFDGHRIDAMIAVTFKTPEGDEITDVIDRIWLLTIIDVATRVIIGYHLSLNKEYTAADVLQCIKKAIIPWVPKTLSIPGLKYPNYGGFPSGVIEETQWGKWSEFCYDNGKANLAEVVRNRLSDVVGCAINPGPVKMPERRSIIERFFGILEENGYHRLPSTTGSNPKDPRRQNPELQAIKYNISYEHLEELTEILIANYNCEPLEGNNFLTPLETLEQRISRGMEIPKMAAEKRNETVFLSLRIEREVKGSIKSGKRPYIQYENVIYRSDILSKTPDLVGSKLTLIVNIEDLRSVKAFLEDGSEFGLLTATGKWGVIPHSLEIRKRIYKLKNQKLLYFIESDDPIDVYMTYLENSSKTKKSSRNQLLKVQQQVRDADKTDTKHLIITNKKKRNFKLYVQDKENNPTSERKLRKTIIVN